MTKLNTLELEMINGGGPLMDIYNDVKEFVNEHLDDLVRGIKDGWNGR